jgi:tRNA(fMet)-specific endonuclease VapC
VRVLDTDVCVEILRGNEELIERRRRTSGPVVTTWITVAELYYGAARSNAPQESGLLVWQFLATLEILELELQAVQRFGRLKAALEAEGRRLADFDLLIAAVALSRRAVLVTGNRRHYDRVPDLEIENWLR